MVRKQFRDISQLVDSARKIEKPKLERDKMKKNSVFATKDKCTYVSSVESEEGIKDTYDELILSKH